MGGRHYRDSVLARGSITVVNQVIRETKRTAAEQPEMREKRGGDALLTGNVENLLRAVRGHADVFEHLYLS